MKPRSFGDGFRRQSLVNRPDLPIIGGAPPPIMLDRFARQISVGDQIALTNNVIQVPVVEVRGIKPHPHPEYAAKGAIIVHVVMQFQLAMQGGVPDGAVLLTVPYEAPEVPKPGATEDLLQRLPNDDEDAYEKVETPVPPPVVE